MEDSLRSAECIERYRESREANVRKSMLFLVPFWRGRLWAIAHNDFPYDKVASRHDLLYPLRVVSDEAGLLEEERAELRDIKLRMEFGKWYDSILENIPHSRTIPGHYHLHLIQFKNLTDFNHG